MTLERFLTRGEPNWTELENLVTEAGSRPSSIGSARVLRLGELYRAATADLSAARQRYPNDPIVQRLETLVIRSRSIVYSKNRNRRSIRKFYGTTYWELIVDRPGLLAFAIASLVVPAVVGYIYAATSPESVLSIVPSAFLWVTEEQPSGTEIGLNSAQLAEFSFLVLVNNIRVTVLAFAVGIGLGIGTFALIALNGVIFGAVAALGVEAGNGALLVEAIVAHGILEFSCIVLGALAGYRLASAVIKPGIRPRNVALVEEAGPAAQLALGTAPFLVLAGFVEGYVSRTGTSAATSIIIGFTLAGAFWLTAALRGTRQNRTRAFASR